jgi:hypothetical protein
MEACALVDYIHQSCGGDLRRKRRWATAIACEHAKIDLNSPRVGIETVRRETVVGEQVVGEQVLGETAESGLFDFPGDESAERERQ